MSHIILPGNSAFASLRNTSNTKLLIHSDTTDGSTTFADSSGQDHTISEQANAQHDIAQKKFGASSMLFDGTGDYLSVADSADWYMGTGAVTVDFPVRFSSVAATQGFFGQYTDDSNFVNCYITRTFPGYVGQQILRFEIKEITLALTYAWSTVAIDTWYHLALIRGWGGSANSWAVCINGTAVVTGTNAGAWGNYTGAFTIGFEDMNDYYLFGWIDEFRVVKGEAMWTTQFQPPIGPYT